MQHCKNENIFLKYYDTLIDLPLLDQYRKDIPLAPWRNKKRPKVDAPGDMSVPSHDGNATLDISTTNNEVNVGEDNIPQDNNPTSDGKNNILEDNKLTSDGKSNIQEGTLTSSAEDLLVRSEKAEPCSDDKPVKLKDSSFGDVTESPLNQNTDMPSAQAIESIFVDNETSNVEGDKKQFFCLLNDKSGILSPNGTKKRKTKKKLKSAVDVP